MTANSFELIADSTFETMTLQPLIKKRFTECTCHRKIKATALNY